MIFMQSKKIKVIVVGLGAMGSGIARLLLEKEAVQVVGAVASRREKQGKDLAEVLDLPKKTGVLVSSLEEALSRDADVVIQCTTSFLG